MKFEWIVTEQEILLKTFLRQQGVSKKLLAKIKFQGGTLLVNGVERTVRHFVQVHDVVTVIIPDEGEHETMLPYASILDIVYEDDHILVVNKPSGVASIPAQYHPNGTMANRVKYYYNQQNYVNRIIHVVTRLDRDTTGLMLFAKHGFAHAMLDKQLQDGRLKKHYMALVSGRIETLEKMAMIDLPIGRDMTSLIKRQVIATGQRALTEYQLVQRTEQVALVDVQLHTGRTHQIRVHFSALGCPLLGDNMYDGNCDLGITRQALHCRRLVFDHPFTKEKIEIQQPLPTDMARLIN
ncbi:RNA pseudouridine synthase [Vagococcus penaei]|uniref:Pseudouridine synthase n=1 Tax=Vagococcus penaei TaxID=633807 RepID=A0A1Q2D703_9ENTE|nr:RluA family pseudouridine synthase [Vagococcus penaei]AQP54164.1 RNA pseudouridine synthase [Vagococcus penaei]RSU02163.1 RNA pseudouridine synthase [Vagococcus penaei]